MRRILRTLGGLLCIALHRIQAAGQLAQRLFTFACFAPDLLDLRRQLGLCACNERQCRSRLPRARIAQRLLRERAQPLPRRRQRAALLGQSLALFRKRRFSPLDERFTLVALILRRARVFDGCAQLVHARFQLNGLPPRIDLSRRDGAPLQLDFQRLSRLPRLRVDLLEPRGLLGVITRKLTVNVADARRLGFERFERLGGGHGAHIFNQHCRLGMRLRAAHRAGLIVLQFARDQSRLRGEITRVGGIVAALGSGKSVFGAALIFKALAQARPAHSQRLGHAHQSLQALHALVQLFQFGAGLREGSFSARSLSDFGFEPRNRRLEPLNLRFIGLCLAARLGLHAFKASRFRRGLVACVESRQQLFQIALVY